MIHLKAISGTFDSYTVHRQFDVFSWSRPSEGPPSTTLIISAPPLTPASASSSSGTWATAIPINHTPSVICPSIWLSLRFPMPFTCSLACDVAVLDVTTSTVTKMPGRMITPEIYLFIAKSSATFVSIYCRVLAICHRPLHAHIPCITRALIRTAYETKSKDGIWLVLLRPHQHQP